MGSAITINNSGSATLGKKIKTYVANDYRKKSKSKIKSISDDSKSFSHFDTKKLEIGEFFLEKYLKSRSLKKDESIKKWDKLLKKTKKLKNPFFKQTSSSSPSSINSSLTLDITLIDLFFKSNRGKFLSKINHSPGPPMKYRFFCWKAILNILNGPIDLTINNKPINPDYERDIKKDLHRTYPTQTYFNFNKENYEIGLGEKHLYTVLRNIASNYPRIGYCQGMNFLVGYLLMMSGGKEDESFYMFERMGLDMRYHIFALFENNFPLVNLYVHLFWSFLKEINPDIKKHLNNIGVPDHAWISKWFMMMFLYSLPLDIICRVWDFILSEESLLSMIKLALALMKILKPDLMKLTEIHEIMEYFKILKGGLYEPYQSVIFNEITTHNQPRSNLKGDILVREARKIKLNNKMITEFTKDFMKSNPNFQNHLIIQYYSKFDSIDKLDHQIFEKNLKEYYLFDIKKKNSEDRKNSYIFSFENIPPLKEDEEFIGIEKNIEIPVFEKNEYNAFSTQKTIKVNEINFSLKKIKELQIFNKYKTNSEESEKSFSSENEFN